MDNVLHIVGMGTAHPTTSIDNHFLEALDVGTNAQWIEEKIGILERVSTLPLDYIRTTRNQDPRMALDLASMTPTDMGVKAAEAALKQVGISANDIGMIIVNSCAPSQTIPGEAVRIAERLGASAVAFDVVTACPAFALHIDFLRNYDESELPEFVLCISTAALTQHVNYNDRSDGAIWGDAAAAWIVSPVNKGKLEVLNSSFTADPTRCGAVVVDTFGFFKQDGRAVRDFSVRQTVRLIKAIEDSFSIDWNRDVFIGHQANRTMLEQVTNNREIPPSNHWHNVTYLGNQAGAGSAATLCAHWDKIVPGQHIVVAVVGAGLS
ncbi:MAG: 3-oxoacyl-ACP synthase III family protein, partial [Alphaproteobacteria bacterium]